MDNTANLQWVATKAEADVLAKMKSKAFWGIELRKVNKANRKYSSGYVVSWGETKGDRHGQ